MKCKCPSKNLHHVGSSIVKKKELSGPVSIRKILLIIKNIFDHNYNKNTQREKKNEGQKYRDNKFRASNFFFTLQAEQKSW